MKKGILIVLHILLIVFLVYAEKPTYVGAKECKPCHKGPNHGEVYEKWKKAAHARAFETLKAKGEEKNLKCLKCHVTGLYDGGYKLNDPHAMDFEGVQCESCHGKGSLYMKSDHMHDSASAVINGLLIPVEVVCTKCHNKESPHFKGFNYKESLKRITHIYRKHY
ncbi:MAG: hypothetical protein JSV88_31355 [Candidatus Aminicenantes bacterium]|nr:MAG: hypothetical protein JSV88_31355 [Candidatus Aminicenantes bacterium]